MSKIFAEIKKAIEEEMRNAEGRPPAGGQRQGGRRAQEYAEWLKQEQERLRGGSQPEPLEETPVESGPLTEQQWEQQTENEWRSRQVRQPDPERNLERPRSRESTPRRQERSTQYQRSEARHERETTDAYRPPGGRGSRLKDEVHGLLRSPQGLRQAFILREIVSKPISLRDKDDHLIS